MNYIDCGIVNDRLERTVNENRVEWTTLLDILDPNFKPNYDMFYDEKNKLYCFPFDHSHKLNKEEGFSRDNLISWMARLDMYCMRELAQRYLDANFSWRLHFQPQDVVYFKYVCGNGLATRMLWIVKYSMYVSTSGIVQCGNGEMDTDGHILAFIRCWGGRNKNFEDIWKAINVRLLDTLTGYVNSSMASEREKSLKYLLAIGMPWAFIFAVYFRDTKHPVVEAAFNGKL